MILGTQNIALASSTLLMRRKLTKLARVMMFEDIIEVLGNVEDFTDSGTDLMLTWSPIDNGK